MQHVLIVDDIAQNIQVVANTIKELDIKIHIARNGKSAINYCLEYPYDLILLDIMLPDIDGIEVCSILKKHEKTSAIPIIFLTAKTEQDIIIKGFNAGAVDYITKPFNSTELIARVKTHLHIQKQSKDIINQNKNLQILNSEKDRFISIISHDLKNPFHTLLGLTDLLNIRYQSFSDEKRLSYIKSIYSSARTIYNLLENLLTWTLSQSAQLKITKQTFAINLITQNTINLLSENSNVKNISIVHDNRKNFMVYADAAMIETVIRNLLSNAIKFTNINGSITINYTQTDTHTTVSITDTGIGIELNNLSTLFTAGNHIRSNGTSNETGTGLGLLICKEFMGINNGRIWAESIPDKGSTFFVELPQNNYD